MVMEGTIGIETKNGMIMTGIVAHGAVACPEDLPVRLKECAVECFKMEEGVVVPIRTIDGVVEIGSVIINVTDTTVTIDTPHQIIIAITEIGIGETDPIRINEVDTRLPLEVTQATITACHRVVTIRRVIIRTDMPQGMIVEEVPRVVAVVAQGETSWTIEEVVVAAEEDVATTTEGHRPRLARSFQG